MERGRNRTRTEGGGKGVNANRITAYSVRQRGFTMAEVLVVMAIIMVLSGIGVPNALRMMNSARQISLNRSAETIYMTAQRNLIAAKLAGTPLDDTYSKVTKNKSDSTANGADKNIVLPASTISPALYAGSWIIEYDKDKFLVKKVQYSETVALADFITYANSIGKIGSYG